MIGNGREARQVTSSRKTSNYEDDRLYQNIHPNTPHRGSPTKKSHLSPVSVPVPEGYYSLTPPTLVRRHTNSNNVSPSSSPEESTLSLFSPPMSETALHDHSHSDRNGQELSMAIVGDNLVVNKSAHPLSKTLSPPSDGAEIGGVYQNVEFMRTDNQGPRRYIVRSYLYMLKCSNAKGVTVSLLGLQVLKRTLHYTQLSSAQLLKLVVLT